MKMSWISAKSRGCERSCKSVAAATKVHHNVSVRLERSGKNRKASEAS